MNVKVNCLLVPDTDVEQVINRVSSNSGEVPEEYEVLKNIGVVLVTASQKFVDELAKQPEIKNVEVDGEMGVPNPVVTT